MCVDQFGVPWLVNIGQASPGPRKAVGVSSHGCRLVLLQSFRSRAACGPTG